jgi:ribosomal protein S12 methylthiotransferase accessory factor
MKIFNKTYSLTYQYKKLPFFSNGKGFSSYQARKSAFGEMCERMVSKNYLEDYFLANLYPDSKVCDFLDNNLKQFYQLENLTKEDLIDFNSCANEILSIPFVRHSDRKKYIFQ